MSDAIKPIGQLTNIRMVSEEQLQSQKTLRRLENDQFNPNVVGHTNPGLRDPGKIVEDTGPKNTPSASVHNVAVSNNSSEEAPQDLASVTSAVSMNTSLKSPVGGKVSASA